MNLDPRRLSAPITIVRNNLIIKGESQRGGYHSHCSPLIRRSTSDLLLSRKQTFPHAFHVSFELRKERTDIVLLGSTRLNPDFRVRINRPIGVLIQLSIINVSSQSLPLMLTNFRGIKDRLIRFPFPRDTLCLLRHGKYRRCYCT